MWRPPTLRGIRPTTLLSSHRMAGAFIRSPVPDDDDEPVQKATTSTTRRLSPSSSSTLPLVPEASVEKRRRCDDEARRKEVELFATLCVDYFRGCPAVAQVLREEKRFSADSQAVQSMVAMKSTATKAS